MEPPVPPPTTAAGASLGPPAGPSVGPFPDGVPDGDTVVFGPDIADESELRCVGSTEGRRILELGVGNGRNAVALARGGARVIAVDHDADRVARARDLAARHDVRVEFHHADLAEIAFLRADTIDLVLSVHALAAVPDTERVFRQAHRVLRAECPLVLALPHPALNLVDPHGTDPRRIARSWFDTGPRRAGSGAETTYPVTFSGLFGGLFRAGFRVETVAEPPPLEGGARSPWWSDVMRLVPATLIVRARKVGL